MTTENGEERTGTLTVRQRVKRAQKKVRRLRNGVRQLEALLSGGQLLCKEDNLLSVAARLKHNVETLETNLNSDLSALDAESRSSSAPSQSESRTTASPTYHAQSCWGRLASAETLAQEQAQVRTTETPGSPPSTNESVGPRVNRLLDSLTEEEQEVLKQSIADWLKAAKTWREKSDREFLESEKLYKDGFP